jgi:hypothetical protein
MRAVRRLLIVLVVLAILFTAADRISVAVAQSQAASRIQSSKGLNKKPSVSIEGFPFLTQLLSRNLDEVKLSADGLTVGGGSGNQVTLQSFHADLHGVRLQNGFSSATVSSATGTAVISYADLSTALPNHLTASYGGNGRVRLTGTEDVSGLSFQGTAAAKVSVTSGDSIGLSDVSVENISGAPGPLGGLAGTALTELLDNTTLKFNGIPVGLRLEAIAAQPDGVQVTLSGSDLNLGG